MKSLNQRQLIESHPMDDCAQEPIHIPGAIQAHGCLIAIDERPGTIVQISANCETYLDLASQQLLGHTIASFFDEASRNRWTQALAASDLRSCNPLPLTFSHGPRFEGILHRHDGTLIVELEPAQASQAPGFFSFYHSIRSSILALQAADNYQHAFRTVVDEVQRITGYNRVLLYRFEDNWNGIVEAEANDGELTSYLGQRFPASDIPAQARALYAHNPLRIILDGNYTPSPLVPVLNPLNGRPLDMSFAGLRSVSPVHLEYMRNMETQSSMSISVLKDGELWALISCHHREARFVPYEIRSACIFLSELLAYQIAAITIRDEESERQILRKPLRHVEDAMSATLDLPLAWQHSAEDLMELTASQGVAYIQNDDFLSLGLTPPEDTLRHIVKWLRSETQDEVFWHHQLPELWAGHDLAGCFGCLAVSLSEAKDSYFIWFRPELVQTIAWAGDPQKVRSADPLSQKISPRRSFALWQEEARGSARAFSQAERDVALEFRNAVLLRQLALINQELRLSNQELDDFAHVVSHDLREPLRGMRHYAEFVLEDEPHLRDLARVRLHSIEKLSKDMEELLDSLYSYSRLGRMDLAFADVDLNEIIEAVESRLANLFASEKVELRIEGQLPIIQADRVRVIELFQNLVSNAIKYNRSQTKIIRIHAAPDASGRQVIGISDNGIGIDAEHRDKVFEMFRRLHARHEYGGGTGTGLAIVKRIVERHKGQIWLESEPGQGSTFLFRLEDKPNTPSQDAEIRN